MALIIDYWLIAQVIVGVPIIIVLYEIFNSIGYNKVKEC